MSALAIEITDWKNPDDEYRRVMADRARRLRWLRSGTPAERTARVDALKAYYADHVADFIDDWGVTVDPRVAAGGREPLMPFRLFPKQRELVSWLLERWRGSDNGIVEKSRDVGASWIAMCVGVTLCLFHRHMMIGIGSAKEDKLDRTGDPDTLMYKACMFLSYLPVEFTGGWSEKKNHAHLRLVFPDTDSSITGEAGDNIGRGGRKSIYFVDESAHVEHPELVDSALIANTDCRIDISSVYGMANSFAEKRHSGKYPVFTFHWRDDPRKDDAWYARLQDKYDPITIAQEYDLDYSASVEGQIIPSKWVQAAIGAHKKLNIKITGERRSAFDVADEGKDKCAHVIAHGVLLEWAESWSGKGGDTLDSTHRVYRNCDERKVDNFVYDADGLGATVRSDSRVIGEQRAVEVFGKPKAPPITVTPFRGSGEVLNPTRPVPGSPDRRNEDMFKNYKAQSWWNLRRRFAETVRALEGKPYDPDYIISINDAPDWKERSRLLVELSQPVWKWDATGKMLIDKAPDGTLSPNLADGVMMVFAPRKAGMRIRDDLL